MDALSTPVRPSEFVLAPKALAPRGRKRYISDSSEDIPLAQPLFDTPESETREAGRQPDEPDGLTFSTPTEEGGSRESPAGQAKGKDGAQIMEQRELPVLLVNEVGGIDGVLEAHMEFLKKHFHLITMKEFLKNKRHFSKKVQAIYLWWHKPIIDRELLESLPNLKVIANSGVGMDHLDLKLISSFGVKIANAPHAVSSSTADTGMALLLASARRLVESCQIAVSPDTEYFAADCLGNEVTGATLGIIGMGSIGYKIAQRAKAFEMKILYHNRNQRTEEEEQAVGAIYCKKMEDLLQQSDFVMLVVKLTAQTHKLIGKRELELMKLTAILINISRGPVVDQDALVEALQTGVIKAAALDVTYPEPLPRDHPLLKLNNIIITPHLGIKTDKTTRMITEEEVANILAALSGLCIPSEVFP